MLRLLLATAVFLASACGDDDHKPAPDGSTVQDRLELLDPPGESLGLTFAATATLRVRYLNGTTGEPIRGATVSFSLVTSAGERTGGATLSSESAVTDELGVARVDLVTGAERVNFRVRATAPAAASVLFYIQVSDEGFGDLLVETFHDGPRDPGGYTILHLRLYAGTALRCSELDADDIPDSVFPPRSQQAIGDVSEFLNLAAKEPYTVVGWAGALDGRALAVGCTDLSADKLRSGIRLRAPLTIADRPFELPAQIEAQSTLDLQPLADTLPFEHVWARLTCPLGRAQLLLDCMLDAQAPDGSLDCVVNGSDPLVTAANGQRGPEDSSGCRPGTLGGGGTSLDAELSQALTGWPSDAELGALLAGRATILNELRLDSRLVKTANGLARHELLEARFGTFASDLFGSLRPIVAASNVAAAVDATGKVSVAEHGFTLRLSWLFADAFGSLALVPANVPGQAESLGTELVQGATIGGASGCAALEAFVCDATNLPSDCADQCTNIETGLNTLLATWIASVDVSGIDFRWQASTSGVDLDDDLVLDSVGLTGSSDWQATVETQGGPVGLVGELTGEALP